MAPDPLVTILVSAIDWLMPITVGFVWWVMVRSRVEGPSSIAIAVPLVLALGWGMLWSFVPQFAALRLNPPPGGQAGAILALVFSLFALLLLPATRMFFRTAHLQQLVLIGPWRIVYGSLLLAIGLRGGLPEGFFWSVAIGDIAVGLWAVAILARGKPISARHLTAWNIVGFVDLAHALVLGAIHLRGFFLANPAVPPLNMLPLAGVPLYLGIHALTLWGLWARRRGASSTPAATV